MFIAALFTIARTWKQPRYPTIDEWTKKTWYIYTMENYLAIKRNACESVLIGWKSEREKQISYINTYIQYLERWYQ